MDAPKVSQSPSALDRAKPSDWRLLLVRKSTKDGTPQPIRVVANAIIALRHAPEWEDVLAFNEFSQQTITQRPTPWRKKADSVWLDVDDSLACEWLQREENILVTTAMVAEAVQTVSRENSFHPVRDYLKALTWDHKPRIERWLTDYLGSADSPYVRAVGRRWLISAVARVEKPGCQVDHVLLLEGPQGIRKSAALRELVGDEWFSDHLSDLGSKDSRIDLLDKWVVEMSELVAMRRGIALERVKAFLTARSDHYVPGARL